ncbi:MAG: DUF2220 domain-containing protein [Opitutales bacterium]|nr:DUF2220 domain-containing protein [Opitutales bacterium]
MNPKDSPIGQALFEQWQRARGRISAPRSRPFSRTWARLEDAGLFPSAHEEQDAVRDLRDLETDGWVRLTSERYYRHRIATIKIPLEAESRWKEAFDFTEPSVDQRKQIAEWAWTETMTFLKSCRVNVPFKDLRAIDKFLESASGTEIRLPIKERSLQLFGDEKRLDELFRNSVIFGDGRLGLEDLGCYLVPEPLPWSRGANSDGPVIIIENAATWESFRQWDRIRPRFSAIVYGGGERFREGVRHLSEVFREIGGGRPVFYFGDLDAAGLRIPRLADLAAQEEGLPGVRPHGESYSKLIDRMAAVSPLSKANEEWPSAADFAWLGEISEIARPLLRQYGRIPQEWLNLECLLHG